LGLSDLLTLAIDAPVPALDEVEAETPVDMKRQAGRVLDALAGSPDATSCARSVHDNFADFCKVNVQQNFNP